MADIAIDVYGFVSWCISIVSFVLYIIWSFSPDYALHYIGVTYYPDRFWTLAIPSYLIVVFVCGLVMYNALNYIMTEPLDSFNLITDEHSRWPQKYENENNFKKDAKHIHNKHDGIDISSSNDGFENSLRKRRSRNLYYRRLNEFAYNPCMHVSAYSCSCSTNNVRQNKCRTVHTGRRRRSCRNTQVDSIPSLQTTKPLFKPKNKINNHMNSNGSTGFLLPPISTASTASTQKESSCLRGTDLLSLKSGVSSVGSGKRMKNSHEAQNTQSCCHCCHHCQATVHYINASKPACCGGTTAGNRNEGLCLSCNNEADSLCGSYDQSYMKFTSIPKITRRRKPSSAVSYLACSRDEPNPIETTCKKNDEEMLKKTEDKKEINNKDKNPITKNQSFLPNGFLNNSLLEQLHKTYSSGINITQMNKTDSWSPSGSSSFDEQTGNVSSNQQKCLGKNMSDKNPVFHNFITKQEVNSSSKCDSSVTTADSSRSVLLSSYNSVPNRKENIAHRSLCQQDNTVTRNVLGNKIAMVNMLGNTPSICSSFKKSHTETECSGMISSPNEHSSEGYEDKLGDNNGQHLLVSRTTQVDSNDPLCQVNTINIMNNYDTIIEEEMDSISNSMNMADEETPSELQKSNLSNSGSQPSEENTVPVYFKIPHLHDITLQRVNRIMFGCSSRSATFDSSTTATASAAGNRPRDSGISSVSCVTTCSSPIRRTSTATLVDKYLPTSLLICDEARYNNPQHDDPYHLNSGGGYNDYLQNDSRKTSINTELKKIDYSPSSSSMLQYQTYTRAKLILTKIIRSNCSHQQTSHKNRKGFNNVTAKKCFLSPFKHSDENILDNRFHSSLYNNKRPNSTRVCKSSASTTDDYRTTNAPQNEALYDICTVSTTHGLTLGYAFKNPHNDSLYVQLNHEW